MRIPSGVTDQYIYFVAVDSTDYVSRETGLSSFTVYRSRNGGTAAAMTTPTINETDTTNMPGVYELLLDEDMTIDSGDDSQEMVFHITHTGMAPVTRTIELYRPKITAGNTLGVASDGDVSGNVDGNVVGSVASVTGAVGSVTGNVGGNVVGSVASVTGNVGGIAGTITTLDALDTAQDTQHSTTQSAISGLNDPTAAAIADAVWDETLSGHLGAGSTGEALNAAGAAGDPWTTALPGAYGAGSAGYIIGNNVDAPLSTIDTVVDGIQTDLSNGTDGLGAIKTAVDAIPTSNPTAAAIADAVLDEALSGHVTAGSLGKAVADIETDATAILADTNELQTNQGNWLTATGFSTHSAADVWAVATRVLTANTNLNDPTAAAIADAIWDEAQSGHVSAGSFGELATEIASILADTNELQTDDVPGLIAALNNISTSDVNAQVLDVLATDTFAEPASIPAATATLEDKISFLYTLARNKFTQTSTTQTLRNDADSADIGTSTHSDDGTTYTRGEWT